MWCSLLIDAKYCLSLAKIPAVLRESGTKGVCCMRCTNDGSDTLLNKRVLDMSGLAFGL